jgi:hypothetical protein
MFTDKAVVTVDGKPLPSLYGRGTGNKLNVTVIAAQLASERIELQETTLSDGTQIVKRFDRYGNQSFYINKGATSAGPYVALSCSSDRVLVTVEVSPVCTSKKKPR